MASEHETQGVGGIGSIGVLAAVERLMQAANDIRPIEEADNGGVTSYSGDQARQAIKRWMKWETRKAKERAANARTEPPPTKDQ